MCKLLLLDFVVLQADDGTFVYAIEEREDKDPIRVLGKKTPSQKPIPSMGGVVGKSNPGAERIV